MRQPLLLLSHSSTWGKKELVYTDARILSYPMELFGPKIASGSNMDMFYITQRNATSKLLADIFKTYLNEKNTDLWSRIKDNFQGKTVTISYSDRYVLSKFHAMLVLQFIHRFSELLNLDIEMFQLNLQAIRDEDKVCLKVWDNWNTNEERKNFIKNEILEMDLVDHESLLINVSNRSSHYRQLVIESESNVLTIQPDEGIAHGWKYDKDFDMYNDGDYDLVGNIEEMKLKNTTREDGIQFIVELD